MTPEEERTAMAAADEIDMLGEFAFYGCIYDIVQRYKLRGRALRACLEESCGADMHKIHNYIMERRAQEAKAAMPRVQIADFMQVSP